MSRSKKYPKCRPP